MTEWRRQRIYKRLVMLYGQKDAESVFPSLNHLIDEYRSLFAERERSPCISSEKNIILIAYADIVRRKGETGLETLHYFMDRYCKGLIDSIHLLPFFPYSSDDGFSVIDYNSIIPECGDWENIHALGKAYNLMFDACAINHGSVLNAI